MAGGTAARRLGPGVAETPPPGAKTVRIGPPALPRGLWARGLAPYNDPQRKYVG
jgi:hypothetical protein